MTNRSIPGRAGTLLQGPVPDDAGRQAEPPQQGSVEVRRKNVPPSSTISLAPQLAPAIEAARKHRDRLLKNAHVLDVRAGYKFVHGRITDLPAVVVVVDYKRSLDELLPQDRIPPAVDEILTDVTPADPFDRLRLSPRTESMLRVPQQPQLLIDELQASPGETTEEAIPITSYKAPPDGDLSAVTGEMTVTCHVSPDAGWRVLKPFLLDTEKQLCIGMYDFTAPHIYQIARAVLKNANVRWKQTLGPNESLPTEDDVDSTKANDLTEAQIVKGLRRVAGDRFQSAFAHVGAGQTFASAYHIKVAVRDRKSFWLSSGNWQSSNQPDIDFLNTDADVSLIPRYNREWHVTVDNPALAKTFQVFLEDDFKTARAPVEEVEVLAGVQPDLLIPKDEFLREEAEARAIEVFTPRRFRFTQERPLTIQPILTPDNYLEVMLDLLRTRPSSRLYFQNQSLNPVKAPTSEFEELMQMLIDYSNAEDLDVRLIFRNIGPVRKKLESLKAAGFNMRRVRMQSGCHTKGIVIDSKIVLIGSHNFTNQGVSVNRDASLLIRNEEIAQYYERVFLHDWDQLARDTIREEAMPIPVGAVGSESALENEHEYVRVPWQFFEED